jgi:hypothetical protein
MSYLAISVSFKGNYRERNYAEMFVDIDKYITNHENAFVWKGTADIQKVLQRFLGEERTKRALKIFNLKYNIDKNHHSRCPIYKVCRESFDRSYWRLPPKY